MQFMYDTIKLSEAMLIAALSEKYNMRLSEIHVERRWKGEWGRREGETHTHRELSQQIHAK